MLRRGGRPLLLAPRERADAERPYNTCVVFGPDGRLAAAYHKIHLFDVDLPDGTSLCESQKTTAGSEPISVDVRGFQVGLSICYDVRFPELFRRLLDAGMELLALPAAFTVPTGRAHWEVLVRARAIENLCPVIAAAQEGRHPHGRETWGDSMIVSAWGEVLERLPHGEGVIVADLDTMQGSDVRTRFPALDHRRQELR